MSNFWNEINRLVQDQGDEPPARTPEETFILDTADYLPMVLPALEEHMEEQAEDSREHWRDFASCSRREDIERVALPNVLRELRRFASDGMLEHCLAAAGAMIQLYMREQLRNGRLPILYPVTRIPIAAGQAYPFPIIGEFPA